MLWKMRIVVGCSSQSPGRDENFLLVGSHISTFLVASIEVDGD